jgi:2-(1,2-epoxy-1,2-dihydrophenyl)acetyl-CoA isomerase
MSDTTSNPIDQRSFEEIKVETTPTGVMYVTLNKPERINALTYQMIREVRTAIDDARRDVSVRCVVLRGSGRGFCAGDNLKGMGDAGPEVDQMSRYLTYGYVSAVKAIRALPKPVIASVHGHALGAGFELSLTRAVEMLLTARRLTGQEAGEWGIATEVVSEDELGAATSRWADELASLPTRAMGYMKRALYRAPELSLDEGYQEAAVNSLLVQALSDRAEAKQAWLEKRPPQFQGI